MTLRDSGGRFVSSGRVTVKDKGLRKIRRELEKASRRVVVGVLAGSEPYPDGTTVEEVATWNHWGTETIPARPFITATVEERKTEIKALELRLAKGLFEGKITQEQALEFMGAYIKGEIITKINDFFPPENAPSTIARKGSSKPLVNTKQMVGSIDYQIRDSD